MTFTLDETKLREYLTTEDGLDALGLPQDDGRLTFDPRGDSDDAQLLNHMVWQAAFDSIITTDHDGQSVQLHHNDDESGGYTYVRVEIPFGEPGKGGLRRTIYVTGDTEEARKIGSPDLGAVELVVAIFREVVEEGNRLITNFFDAAAALAPAPTVEVLHERDSDSDCTTRLWVNGAPHTDYAYDDVDPGRGYQASDIRDNIESTQEGDFTPAFKAASVQAWTDALSSGYTTHD